MHVLSLYVRVVKILTPKKKAIYFITYNYLTILVTTASWELLETRNLTILELLLQSENSLFILSLKRIGKFSMTFDYYLVDYYLSRLLVCLDY